MRALILGGGGAIGSAIARHADSIGVQTCVGLRAGTSPVRLAEHPGIRRHQVDVEDAEAVQRLLRNLRPDWLVMTAFPGEGHATTPGSRGRLLSGMGRGVLAVMEAARAAGFAGALTWIGSALSYGDAPRQVRTALRPRTFRGAVKAAESLLVAQLAREYGLRATEIRVFTGYGPYEQRGRLIASLLRAALTGGQVPLAAMPGQRDWIHYQDIARACLASATAFPQEPRVINACSGRLHDTHAVAAMLEAICGRPLVAAQTYPDCDAYGDVVAGSPPEVADGIDWSPLMDLETGLAQSWEWACSPAGRAYLLASPVAA
jgi:nucleoside-diphosphate-sugar epimerase